MPSLEKQCAKCKQVLSEKMFNKSNSHKNGLQPYCKSCKLAHRKENPVLTQTDSMCRNARLRAKEKNIPYDINLDYIRSIAVDFCPIFGVPLEWSCQRDNGGKVLPNSPSLDRIDPERGYVKGNVWIISHRANSIKNNATHEELKLVTKAVGEAIVNSLEF